MKKFKIIGTIITIILIYIIYILTYSNKITYLSLGDALAAGKTPYANYNYGYKEGIISYLEKKDLLESSNDEFIDEYSTIKDLIEDITNNLRLDDKTNIKKEIREADIITISIGNNELEKILNPIFVSVNGLYYVHVEDEINSILSDIETLFKTIKPYAVNETYFLGYYNMFPRSITNIEEAEKIFNYLNTNVEKLCDEYDINYVDTYGLFEEETSYLPNPFSYYPNTKGYQIIADKIIETLEN